MVSEMDGWHSLHTSIAPLELIEQCLVGRAPVCEKTQFHIHLRVITTYSIRFRELRSSSPDSPPFPHARQSSVSVVGPVLVFTSLCSVLLTLLNYVYTSCFRDSLSEVDCSLKEHPRGFEEKNQMKHRNKQMRGDRMGEGTDKVESAKTTRISLSFPISAGLPGFSAQKQCSLIHPPSSSLTCDRETSDGSVWKEETLRDKQLSKVSKSTYLPCSSSSTLPIDLTAPVSKSTLSFSVAGTGPHFPTSALHTSANMDYSETSGAGMPNDYPEHSTTETAHILFNLSARAYQGQVTKDPESSKGKKRKGNSLHVELSLPLPSINPPSSSSNPAPISPSSVSPLTLPPPSFHDSYRAVPKPELLCGVCHRLFSTASSLTVHMRLHRGGRMLSCRHCGKAFIHNKRLQSHEATCRQALPAFPIQPKEEPLEEGEGEKADGAEEQRGQETGPGRPLKKRRGLHGHHARALVHSDGLREDDHFVKVVDGHIIYFCSVCERSYMTLSSLKRHSNVHSWRRKYPCHYCDKVFALAEYRTKHEVWHTGERRYQCIFCWEAFPTYYNLKTHQKTFHGISPGLISSEKTANGGYKQKVNALKLYRLLPMRSQKRPYKTYSQALADGLLKPDSSVTLPLPLDCSLPPALDPSKLESLLKDIHPQDMKDIKPDPDRFIIKMGTDPSKKTTQTEMTTEVSDKEGSDVHLSGNNSSKAKPLKGSEAAVSSVITFGHSKPSVIMHGTSLPSSVIVQRNKVASDDGKNPSESNQAMAKASQKQMKKHSQKEHSHAQSRWDASSSKTEDSKIQQPTEKLHKGRKAHSKSESSKAVPISVDSEAKGSGPLCQITVRIGEEAIVKRSISETDLMRDKSPSLSKSKKSNLQHEDQREQRHTHHHHRKHHGHRSSSQEGREEESKWKNPRVAGKVRRYFFRQEVREDRNEHDREDNLWRPYYSYKPKRKALHIQKVKSWQRKMHYKRSLRLMRRAEKLMNHVNKEVESGEQEEEEEEEEEHEEEEVKEEEKEVIHQKEVKDNTQAVSVSSITEKEEEEKEAPEKLEPPFSAALSQPNTQYTVSSNIKQRWSGEHASECGSCGRWFSSSRKRDKHELTHLFEFVCLLCRAPFPSQTKLEEHQRTNHPKTKPLSTSAPCNSQLTSKENAMDLPEGGDGLSRRFSEKSSPARLGRRPLTRYTCSQCDKVCKTAAALNCHLKRHELGSSTENVQQMSVTQSHSSVISETDKDRSKAITGEHARAIPVINYPKTDSQHTEIQLSEGNVVHQRVGADESPKLAIHSPQLCTTSSPVRLSPTVERSKVISPSLPSVLVMNGAECLDFRTPEKRNLDTQDQRRRSLTPTDRPSQICQIQTVPKVRTETDSASMALQVVKGCVVDDEIETDTQRHRDIHTSDHLNNSQEAQDLRVFPVSRAGSRSQAEDLSMQTILARERELIQQTVHQSTTNKKRSTEEEAMLIVPKEEPLSPVSSPTCSVIQTTQKGSSQRHSQSPCHSPGPLNLQLRPHLEPNQSHQGMHGAEKQRPALPTGSGRGSETSSSCAVLHPQVPCSETETKDSTSTTVRDPRRESGYPVQEFALPLIIPGGYCSGKKQEDQILMSYPPGPLSFGALGKMVPHTDSTKLPFYPDPYHLLYGPQLLPYPYNLAALPMALNMMASGDKVEPLPFLPTLFNYAATGAPFTGTVPHPLMVNPSLYNSSSSSSTKRDSGNP